jgi:hypothetical protein
MLKSSFSWYMCMKVHLLLTKELLNAIVTT